MKTILVIAALLACASAKPRFDNGLTWGSGSDNGQGWGSWSGNGLGWGSGSDNGQANRGLTLSQLCQALQLINNGVQWPACQASSGSAGITAAQRGALTQASLSQLCQQLQAINNDINWPACQLATALGK
ncbi:uncharacterized protein LOC122374238 [Amphibalanus amphitrite]|uniref:uncharacterized protein LOC122374238 n=1 Tax=Amphibalanus amphitrite TaxID=1232801 RepID=UPI001C903883|nr:uncharacterized protein LOC122374238 [Amphibalanus amphitrite]